MLPAMADGSRQAARDIVNSVPPPTLGSVPTPTFGADGRPLQIAVVGVSVSETCGVRAHAELLTHALDREKISCSSHWLLRRERSIHGARHELQVWNAELAGELTERRPDAVLLHYSVFSYSFRGIPIFVNPVFTQLRSRQIPVVTFLHEFAYPWMYGGWRGAAWALTQRALLIDVMRTSRAALVTADFRAAWLASRAWLPHRPLAVAPVFSNLPTPASRPPAQRHRPIVGLFGYSYQGAAMSLTLDAFAMLTRQGVDAELRLLGAPGPSSPAGEGWLASARERGLTDRLSFSGALEAQELSDELGACEVLLCADMAGPSSRKGTLAGSLASGRPVIAIDGPRRWSQLVESEAAQVVPPAPGALADAIRTLLADEGGREALGARGRSFAAQEMTVERTAQRVLTLLDQVLRIPSSH
jgi:glycosyltransferase involved in cell wall biosynthesis